MNEKINIWEQAGKAGLVLGGVSIGYMLITMLTGKLIQNGSATFLLGVLNVLLWIAKFAGCILLMRFFMKRFADANPAADRGIVFRFGARVALLSALLYSAFYLAYVSFIAPDTFEPAISMLEDNPMMDSNTLSAVEEMIPKMPTIAFFGNLIWCWLFGTIVSAVASSRICNPDNPFVE